MASNFRVEHINFYVTDLNTAYHAILGQPALAKFMAIPHYAYQVLKMPLPAGVLSLRANLSITFSRADQWVDIPYTGCFPLVLDTTI